LKTFMETHFQECAFLKWGVETHLSNKTHLHFKEPQFLNHLQRWQNRTKWDHQLDKIGIPCKEIKCQGSTNQEGNKDKINRGWQEWIEDRLVEWIKIESRTQEWEVEDKQRITLEVRCLGIIRSKEFLYLLNFLISWWEEDKGWQTKTPIKISMQTPVKTPISNQMHKIEKVEG
jgi:hypothetical protein